MRNVKRNKESVYIAILILYILLIIIMTLLIRNSIGKNFMHTDWFWGYKSSNPKILYGDNIYNILLFLPVGCLIALIAPIHKLLAATLVGLFLSETIECSQLIWHRGIFDVDDLFNNTVGALLGGLVVVLVLWIKNKRNKE